jgi:hypothetical protein
MKVAVIIKHPGRDWEGDIRVDIIDIPDNADYEIIKEAIRNDVRRNMLGPFEILYITSKINLNREFTMPASAELLNEKTVQP